MVHPRLKRHYSLVAHSADVVELRHGAWNASSVALTDATASGCLLRILKRLDGQLSAAAIADAEGLPEAEVEAVVERLAEQQLLEQGSSHALDHYLDQVATGLMVQEGKSADAPTRVHLLGDQKVRDEIQRILESSGLADRGVAAGGNAALRGVLVGRDESWLFDPLEFEQAARPFAELRGGFTIFGVATINPLELRAFNRVSLHHRLPWLHAAVDGPFLLVGPTFVPFRSACYECLETRVVMNLRDSASYQRYKSALADGRAAATASPLDTVIVVMLASLAAFEAVNFLQTGAAFTVGKLLSVYLPTMEFAFHEVLRLPGCPACGSAPERDDRELYFDARALGGAGLNTVRRDDGP